MTILLQFSFQINLLEVNTKDEQFLFINKFIDNTDLNNNELKLGYALIELFENYEDIFIGTDNNKFNKNIVLLSLREMTNLSTKEIRNSIKKYKKLYFDLVQILSKKCKSRNCYFKSNSNHKFTC